MESDLEKLYQDVILDHYRNPRHTCTLPEGEEDAERLRLSVEDQTISRIEHDTSGCAVSRASASLMSEALQGKSVEQAEDILNAVLTMMDTGEIHDDLGDVRALLPIREFPLRVRCATLPWLAFQDVGGQWG